MKSRIYHGRIRHRRFAPVENEFSYSMHMLYLDLAELPGLFRGRLLWSAERPAVAWFRRKDHFGDPAVPLDTAVRDLVEERTGRRPAGPIRLLTHPRYFGFVMNPVSLYYCFDADERLETVVAEVENTPWNERHCYVLSREESLGNGDRLRFRFPKEFHVSPFMGMEQEYEWRLAPPGEKLHFHMENHEGGEKLLDATLTLDARPVTGGNLARALLSHPFMTGKVIAGIYWQALRLWWKRAPFFPHPAKAKEKTTC